MSRPWLWAAPLAVAATMTGCAHRDAPAGTGSAQAKESIPALTIDEVDAKIAEAKAGKAKLAIYDTNSQARWTQSHVPTAKWVDHSQLKASDLPDDKDTTLVFYCANEH